MRISIASSNLAFVCAHILVVQLPIKMQRNYFLSTAKTSKKKTKKHKFCFGEGWILQWWPMYSQNHRCEPTNRCNFDYHPENYIFLWVQWCQILDQSYYLCHLCLFQIMLHFNMAFCIFRNCAGFVSLRIPIFNIFSSLIWRVIPHIFEAWLLFLRLSSLQFLMCIFDACFVAKFPGRKGKHLQWVGMVAPPGKMHGHVSVRAAPREMEWEKKIHSCKCQINLTAVAVALSSAYKFLIFTPMKA